MRDLSPDPTQEGHSDHHKLEEKKGQMLELLKEEFDLDYNYNYNSDSDTDYRYQTLV